MIEYIKDLDGNILHIVHRANNDSIRDDIVNPSEFIQVAYMRPESGQSFQPHYHLKRTSSNDTVITQETWIIISGSIEAFYYDESNSLLCRRVLNKSDCTITLGGGHSYKCLEEETVVYEIKNGPYVGRENDKEYFTE
jgi:cupin fold WbuC family metalloprotein